MGSDEPEGRNQDLPSELQDLQEDRRKSRDTGTNRDVWRRVRRQRSPRRPGAARHGAGTPPRCLWLELQHNTPGSEHVQRSRRSQRSGGGAHLIACGRGGGAGVPPAAADGSSWTSLACTSAAPEVLHRRELLSAADGHRLAAAGGEASHLTGACLGGSRGGRPGAAAWNASSARTETLKDRKHQRLEQARAGSLSGTHGDRSRLPGPDAPASSDQRTVRTRRAGPRLPGRGSAHTLHKLLLQPQFAVVTCRWRQRPRNTLGAGLVTFWGSEAGWFSTISLFR